MILAELDRIHKNESGDDSTSDRRYQRTMAATISEADRENALRRLMEYRYLCYVAV